MKVGRVEIGVQQSGRPVQSARSDIVLRVVKERAGWNVTAGAAETGIMGKRPVEKRFAAPLSVAGIRIQFTARTETGVGQKIDVLDVSDQRIEHGGGGLRTGKFADDDIMNKIAQRSRPPRYVRRAQDTARHAGSEFAPDRERDYRPSD